VKKRAIIVDGPGYYDFVFMLPFYGCRQDPPRKFLFLLDDPKDMPGDPKVILLTIKQVNDNGKVGEWHFEGEAGDRPFKGFLSTITGSGWIEPV
jgi:hypothetical protein